MHIQQNVLTWIYIPLVLSWLSEAICCAPVDITKTSPQKLKNGEHIREERQTLLRAFVLGNFIPFADQDEDGVKRSQSSMVGGERRPKKVDDKDTGKQTKGSKYIYTDKRKEKAGDGILETNQSNSSSPLFHSNLEEITMQTGANNYSSMFPLVTTHPTEDISQSDTFQSHFVQDNEDKMGSQGHNWYTSEPVLSDEMIDNYNMPKENEDDVDEDYTYLNGDVENHENIEHDQEQDVNEQNENDKTGMFVGANYKEIDQFLGEGNKIEPSTKKDSRFGEFGYMGVNHDTKTEDHSQERKLGFLINATNNAQVPSLENAKYKALYLRKSSHSSANESQTKSKGRFGDQGDMIVNNDTRNETQNNYLKRKLGLRNEAKGVHVSSQENAKHKTPSYQKRKLRPRTESNDIHVSQENAKRKTSTTKGDNSLLDEPQTKKEVRFGDLSDMIVNNIRNKTENSSQKRKSGPLTVSRNVQVSPQENANKTSSKKKDNALVGEHPTKRKGRFGDLHDMIVNNDIRNETENKYHETDVQVFPQENAKYKTFSKMGGLVDEHPVKKSRFGDLGDMIVNNDITNKTENNSQKRKLGILTERTDVQVSPQENAKYKTSSKKGDDGLVDENPVKKSRFGHFGDMSVNNDITNETENNSQERKLGPLTESKDIRVSQEDAKHKTSSTKGDDSLLDEPQNKKEVRFGDLGDMIVRNGIINETRRNFQKQRLGPVTRSKNVQVSQEKGDSGLIDEAYTKNGHFGDLSDMIVNNIRHKTENNSQERKLGPLTVSRNVQVSPQENAKYKTSSKKKDNVLVDEHPTKKKGRFGDLHDMIVNNDIRNETENKYESDVQVSPQENAKYKTFSKMDGLVDEHPVKKSRFGDLGDMIVNNDITNETENNSQKRKLGPLTKSKDGHVSSQENVKYETSSKKGENGLVNEHPTKKKAQFGDLGDTIVNNDIRNEIQNNSQKRELGHVTGSKIIQVSQEQGNNGLVAEPRTENEGQFGDLGMKTRKLGLLGEGNTVKISSQENKNNFLDRTIIKSFYHQSTRGINLISKGATRSNTSHKRKIVQNDKYSTDKSMPQKVTVEDDTHGRQGIKYSVGNSTINASSFETDSYLNESRPLPTYYTKRERSSDTQKHGESYFRVNSNKGKRMYRSNWLTLNEKRTAKNKNKIYLKGTSEVLKLKGTKPIMGSLRSKYSYHRRHGFSNHSKFKIAKKRTKHKKKEPITTTVERHGVKNKITIEQNLPETEGYDLYILKVPPSRIVAKTTKARSALSQKRNHENKLNSSHVNQSYVDVLVKKLEKQISLVRNLLDTPVKTIFDFFSPYFLGKANIGKMKLRDVEKELRKSTTDGNVSDIMTNRSTASKHLRNRLDTVTKISKELRNGTKSLQNNKSNKKDALRRQNSARTLVGNSEVVSEIHPKQNTSFGSGPHSHKRTYTKPIPQFEKGSSKTTLRLKQKSEITGAVRSSLGGNAENLPGDLIKEEIKVFLRPSSLEYTGSNSKKSFIIQNKDDVRQATRGDRSKSRTNKIRHIQTSGHHKAKSKSSTTYFIPLTNSRSEQLPLKTKRKATSTEPSISKRTQVAFEEQRKTNDIKIPRASSGEISVRSTIRDIEADNRFYAGFRNSDANENIQTSDGMWDGTQSGAIRIVPGGNTYRGNPSANLQQNDVTQGQIGNNQFSPGLPPSQFTFYIHQAAQTAVVPTQQATPHLQAAKDGHASAYKGIFGIFGNTEKDLEESCINFGKQDFVDYCPSGWTNYKQFCYMAMPGANRWSDISGLCSSNAAKMAMPKSQDVLAFLVNHLISKKQYSTPYFVGLRKRDEEWEWIDDTPLSEGLPDGKESDSESCAVLLEGSLRKMSCDINGGYICELKMGVRASRVLAMGDSLTNGYFNGGKNYHPYGEKLEELLNRDDHSCFVVEISGKNGETSSTMVRRMTDYLNTNQRTFNWVIILAGTNDLLVTMDSSEEIADRLMIMHEVVHARGAKSIAVTIPEIFCERTTCPAIRERRLFVNKRLRTYADGEENKIFLSDIAFRLSLHRLPLSDRKAFWEASGVHMKPGGYNKMAEIIFRDLMEAMEASTTDR